MIRRLIPILVLLSIPFAAPALAQGSFTELEREAKDKIGRELEVEARLALLARIGQADDRDGANLLMECAGIVSNRIDAMLKTLGKLEAEHEKLNTNQDVAQDDFKSRTEVREKIAAVEAVIASHRQVMDQIYEVALTFKAPPAQAVICGAASSGKEWRQRGIAAQTAANYPTEDGRKAALKALKDKEPRVVIRVLFGLKTRRDPLTVDGIVDVLDKDNWVVRSAAADALAAIGAPQAIRPLVELIPKTTGRLQDDINDALQRLTGQKFDPDYEQWKRWYEEHAAEIEGADAKPLAKKRGRGGDEEDDSTYYGIKSRSKRIVYVLDLSGSMEKPIGGGGVVSPRDGEEERASGPKIEIAKNELKNAIRKLPEDALFNIITFNHLVKRWEPKLIKATQANKNKAYLFIRGIKASGSTFTYGALKEAFNMAGMGANDPNYKSGVDTIFLLSDGAPTDQSFPQSKLMDIDKILTAVKQWNSLSKVIIHAIAIDVNTQGSSFIRFMKQLADENGGKYIERG